MGNGMSGVLVCDAAAVELRGCKAALCKGHGIEVRQTRSSNRRCAAFVRVRRRACFATADPTVWSPKRLRFVVLAAAVRCSISPAMRACDAPTRCGFARRLCACVASESCGRTWPCALQAHGAGSFADLYSTAVERNDKCGVCVSDAAQAHLHMGTAATANGGPAQVAACAAVGAPTSAMVFVDAKAVVGKATQSVVGQIVATS